MFPKKFNIGDSIDYRGWKGTVTDCEYEAVIMEWTYKVTLPSSGYLWVTESQLSPDSRCDCGAKYDREFPNVHMFFCSTNQGVKNGD